MTSYTSIEGNKITITDSQVTFIPQVFENVNNYSLLNLVCQTEHCNHVLMDVVMSNRQDGCYTMMDDDYVDESAFSVFRQYVLETILDCGQIVIDGQKYSFE